MTSKIQLLLLVAIYPCLEGKSILELIIINFWVTVKW
jgi:hypothetical protein